MKLAALISSGKDSIFALHKAIEEDYRISLSWINPANIHAKPNLPALRGN